MENSRQEMSWGRSLMLAFIAVSGVVAGVEAYKSYKEYPENLEKIRATTVSSETKPVIR